MIEINNQSSLLADAMTRAQELTNTHRDEFLMPEHLLLSIAWQPQFLIAVPGALSIPAVMLEFIEKFSPTVPENVQYNGATPSSKFVEMLHVAAQFVAGSGSRQVDVPHIIRSMMQLNGSFAHDVLVKLAGDKPKDLMERIERQYFDDAEDDEDVSWQRYAQRMLPDHSHPMMGRREELTRTMQILCRRDKNCPLFVGDAGVGKTTMAHGLNMKLRNASRLPAFLRDSVMYRLDTAALIAGTNMHGDLEKRLKYVCDTLSEPERHAILYIDDLYALCCTGHESESITGVLLQYLERGKLRIVASMSTGDWNLCQTKSKALARRFEPVDLKEPSVAECEKWIRGIIEGYEEYYGIIYSNEAIAMAPKVAEKYMTGRCLPDKAIDLIDEAGAMVATSPHHNADPVFVMPSDIAKTLARICRVESLADSDDDTRKLASLEGKIKTKVYGQDEAVHQVSEAVLMASAGLADETKPMASLLFVGPTGVGKTELARVLADELHLPLVRLDMSEYAEKHTVSKLIGSPAGYVGYDDGGILTDAVRRTPHCVLLFDEIEKAHPDIYNTLLQVLDYGTLTDNRGQKANFRHTIILMTTNAGAQYAGQGATMGFAPTQGSGTMMLKEVKRTFKPEFLNRLTAITVFHDMDRTMAGMILDKKLGLLAEKLKSRKVKMKFSDSAREYLLTQCFSPKYGGREADRVIDRQLKPLLMQAILFGDLKLGGTAKIDLQDEQLTVAAARKRKL